jgi:hypothetical protein
MGEVREDGGAVRSIGSTKREINIGRVRPRRGERRASRARHIGFAVSDLLPDGTSVPISTPDPKTTYLCRNVDDCFALSISAIQDALALPKCRTSRMAKL